MLYVYNECFVSRSASYMIAFLIQIDKLGRVIMSINCAMVPRTATTAYYSYYLVWKMIYDSQSSIRTLSTRRTKTWKLLNLTADKLDRQNGASSRK